MDGWQGLYRLVLVSIGFSRVRARRGRRGLMVLAPGTAAKPLDHLCGAHQSQAAIRAFDLEVPMGQSYEIS